MRGSLKQRSKGSWSLILDLGYEIDAETGRQKRRQKWVTFRGTRQKAEKRLTELLTAADGGTFIDASQMTLGVWLTEWLEASVKPQCRASTYTRYKGIINNDLLKAPFAACLVQKLRPSHLETYY